MTNMGRVFTKMVLWPITPNFLMKNHPAIPFTKKKMIQMKSKFYKNLRESGSEMFLKGVFFQKNVEDRKDATNFRWLRFVPFLILIVRIIHRMKFGTLLNWSNFIPMTWDIDAIKVVVQK